MNSHYLTEEEVIEIVRSNLYHTNNETRFHSRCMSNFQYGDDSIPSISLPGGDLGDLAILYAAADYYGFTVDYAKALTVLEKLINGKENLSFDKAHFDAFSTNNYYYYLFKNPEIFDISHDSSEKLKEIFEGYSHAEVEKLKTYHQRASTAIFYSGKHVVLPSYTVESRLGNSEGHMYVYQKSHLDERHTQWVIDLLDANAVELFDGLDASYLYEALSEMTDRHVLEFLRLYDQNIPIFGITESPSGKLKISSYS